MYFPSASGPSPVAAAGASREARKSKFLDSILNANCDVWKTAERRVGRKDKLKGGKKDYYSSSVGDTPARLQEPGPQELDCILGNHGRAISLTFGMHFVPHSANLNDEMISTKAGNEAKDYSSFPNPWIERSYWRMAEWHSTSTSLVCATQFFRIKAAYSTCKVNRYYHSWLQYEKN